MNCVFVVFLYSVLGRFGNGVPVHVTLLQPKHDPGRKDGYMRVSVNLMCPLCYYSPSGDNHSATLTVACRMQVDLVAGSERSTVEHSSIHASAC
jgi:hypothetical protein